VLDLFAYDRAQDQALVLAAGVPANWLLGQGCRNRQSAHPLWQLDLFVETPRRRLVLTIAEAWRLPLAVWIFRWPSGDTPGRASLNGQPLEWENDKELRVHALPAVIAIEITADGRSHNDRR